MNGPSQAAVALAPWKILIADDDRDVHEATRLALRGIRFRGRPLEFVDAYSGAETITSLLAMPNRHANIAPAYQSTALAESTPRRKQYKVSR